MAATLKATAAGLALVDQARRKKGWTKTEQAWADLATTSPATMRRFWAGMAVQSTTLRAICAAVGIEDWKRIVEEPIRAKENDSISSKRLSFAIAGSIEEIDKHKLDAIVGLLRQLGGDTSIEILDIDEGSVRLTLGGSSAALERIESLFHSGELTEVLSIPVESVHTIGVDELSQCIRENGGSFLNFRNVDLRGADLREVDLHDADLRGAKLQRADLSGALLYGADLSGANLGRANLRNANLRVCNLLKVDLSHADIRRAKMQGSNLREVT